jgi:hypothetical protein
MENSETNTIEEAKPTAALYAALVKAQAMMRGVEKDGNNQHHGYRYASAEAMMLAALSVMRETGLAFTAIRTRVEPARGPCDAMLIAEYEMIHESGEAKPYFSETPIHVGKGKLFDKALATAKTYDLSYTLRGALTIPRVDEADERDSQDDAIIQAYASEQQKARVKREKAAAAEHKEKRKALKLEGDLIKEHAPPFFAAASLTMDKQTKGAFLLWAANAEAWSRDVNVQIEITAAAAAYLIEWGQMEDVDALQAANDFCRHLTGDVLGNDEVKF